MTVLEEGWVVRKINRDLQLSLFTLRIRVWYRRRFSHSLFVIKSKIIGKLSTLRNDVLLYDIIKIALLNFHL